VDQTVSLNQTDAFERIAEILGCKWSLMILDLIEQGTNRPGAIERSLPGLTATVLHRCLRRMERDGLLEKQEFDVVPFHVEYRLSTSGGQFRELVQMARSLAQEWPGTQLAKQTD
jgi:DNA-binding HxlR family transcriptional regulator